MRKFGLLGTSALGSAAAFGLSVGFAAPAYAQGTTAQAAQPTQDCSALPTAAEREACATARGANEGAGAGEPDDPNSLGQNEVELESGEAATSEEAIVVTGSRIRRPNLVSNVPITSVSTEELLDRAAPQLGDALNDLPSLRSTFGSSNSQRFIGTTGLALLDLRGLGTERTLVLVNGRRHVTASAGDFRVDVNTIPQELLERVDVVTGGNSAVYGSDAIAGVVNFILKRDFEGIEGRAQGSISSRGDRGSYFASLAAGRNFADGRANIAATAEYSFTQEVQNVQRPNQSGSFIGFNGFIQTDVDPAGTPVDDGIPDNTFQRGVRYNFISEGGTLTTFCFGQAARQPLACQPNGLARFYRFGPDGRLAVGATPERDFRESVPGSSFAIGGNGSTLSDYGTLFPQIERYSLNLLGHFDVTPAFKPFIEAKYARVNTFGQSSPSFLNSFCGGLRGLAGLDPCFTSSSVPIRLDNPFLNPQDAETIRNIQRELLLRGGVNPDLPANTPTFFRLNRNNLDVGIREENNKRETYRIVGGIEGDFNEDWRYEVSATYGKFEAQLFSGNNVINANLRNALDSVRVNGSIVCRINADADAANNDPACVPINPFGTNAVSPEAREYVTTTSLYEESASQFDALAFVSGDSSQLFELPGGPIRFVLGGEYREEKSRIEVDELTRTRQTFLTALQPFSAPTLKVKEAFGEISIPILSDLPFFQELEFVGTARYSDYNEGAGQTDKTFAYNLGVTWTPIQDIRFRGNYSQAVRSPTPGSLFSEQGQNFAFLTDPCDARFINAGPPQRVANCRSDTRLGNVPADYIQQPGNRSILQGGNPLLEEETSKSLTVGAVLQPRFLPGFSLTVDYYDIEVEDVIASLSGNAILSQCYDAENFPNNPFCDLVGDRQPGGFLNPNAAVTVTTVNFAKLTAQGIDFDVAYRRTFETGDRLTLRGIATWNLDRTNFLDVLNPTAPNRVRSELGDPEWAANFNASYKRGITTLSYSLRYIGKQTIATYETQNAFNGRPAFNPDAFDRVYYPDVFYHNLRLEFDPTEQFNFYLGVDNVTDRLPPLGLTGGGAGSGIYDNIGRVFYAGAEIKF